MSLSTPPMRAGAVDHLAGAVASVCAARRDARQPAAVLDVRLAPAQLLDPLRVQQLHLNADRATPRRASPSARRWPPSRRPRRGGRGAIATTPPGPPPARGASRARARFCRSSTARGGHSPGLATDAVRISLWSGTSRPPFIQTITAGVRTAFSPNHTIGQLISCFRVAGNAGHDRLWTLFRSPGPMAL